jgi:hypothetical protein
MFGCLEVEKIKRTCTVFLKDRTTLEIKDDVRKNRKTGTITYRDEEGRLWSLYETAYDSLVCP